MTTARRDGEHQSPFLKWIRACPDLDSRIYNLSVTDSDVWIHRFASRAERSNAGPAPVLEHLQLIEVKSFGADVPYAQRDTLNVIDLVLREVTTRPSGKRVPLKVKDSRHAGCFRNVRWLGVHIVRMSHERPDNSERIIWDQHDVTEPQLIELLRFHRDPDSPTKLLDTRRHHRRPARELQPQMPLGTA